MPNKTKSFNKHVYAIIAIIVLLIAAGIASYAGSVPAGSASHNILYVNTLLGKGRSSIDVNDTLMGQAGLIGKGSAPEVPGVLGTNAFNNGVGVTGYSLGSNGVGVLGSGATGVQGVGASGSTGSLGTADAGVEGTSDANYGVRGSTTAGAPYAGIRGESSIGSYGELGKYDYGVYAEGYHYGVMGVGPTSGVRGSASVASGYGGYFTGGKGLYASKMETPGSISAGSYKSSGATGVSGTIETDTQIIGVTNGIITSIKTKAPA